MTKETITKTSVISALVKEVTNNLDTIGEARYKRDFVAAEAILDILENLDSSVEAVKFGPLFIKLFNKTIDAKIEELGFAVNGFAAKKTATKSVKKTATPKSSTVKKEKVVSAVAPEAVDTTDTKKED